VVRAPHRRPPVTGNRVPPQTAPRQVTPPQPNSLPSQPNQHLRYTD